MKRRIILGTRGSDLALTQARLAEAAMRAKWPELEIEMEIIRTSGDEAREPGAAPEVSIGTAGRKGLFTAEIERALIAGTVDAAVHSAKDLPSALGSRTEIGAVLPRGSVEDVLVSLGNYDLESLPYGGTVATGSVRRQHQLRWKRPDLQIAELRGNVPTRLRKLTAQKWDGIVLARAGLERLGIRPNENQIDFETNRLFFTVLPADVFVPAGGQGVIALQIRVEDDQSRDFVRPINHQDTRVCLRVEREFLRLLEADCNQPVGVYAIGKGNEITVLAQIFDSGSNAPREAKAEGKPEDAEQLAANLLHRINGG
ncbi:MAG TPA: hydroxymethylbilane synthase [Chthoniobacterales bacterium]|nr:hydroxymethylbilane synthase [Chthoniobacterales bacterium]